MIPTLLFPTRHQNSLQEHSFEVVPHTGDCARIYARADHVLIGVSPGNSYFTSDRLAELARWSLGHFEAVDFVYADLHVDAMFEATGYTAEHAAKRAAKEVKAVRRRIAKGLDEAEAPSERVRVHALSEFAGSAEYRELHAEVLHALAVDREFQLAAEDMVRQVVGGRTPDDEAMSAAQRQAGLDYLAAELPFFLDTPAILGVPTSVGCYHKTLPLVNVLYTRQEGLRAADGQAYAVVRPRAVEALSAA
ncbi:tRNA-dependent cyclodipeptide synthase [Streptacidiphilus sp. EB129]|uniref:tRNA-dependent cyclodipeptide synthase n=1 Tax=Streptacidiphilus sp. EB129 TaxID=3156262 RepID=UPI00351730E9